MARSRSRTKAVRTVRDRFLDTSYVIALVCADDIHHAAAMKLEAELQRSRRRVVTTSLILFEIGDALAKPRYRNAAVQIIRTILKDERIQVASLSDRLFRSDLALFESRPDKSWGLTDCISFVVMQDRGLTDALSADRHFVQAGFPGAAPRRDRLRAQDPSADGETQ